MKPILTFSVSPYLVYSGDKITLAVNTTEDGVIVYEVKGANTTFEDGKKTVTADVVNTKNSTNATLHGHSGVVRVFAYLQDKPNDVREFPVKIKKK
jgi:hypothetical protein